jgi:hypothetical protein
MILVFPIACFPLNHFYSMHTEGGMDPQASSARKQYEVVAKQEIKEHEVIAEYVGKVVDVIYSITLYAYYIKSFKNEKVCYRSEVDNKGMIYVTDIYYPLGLPGCCYQSKLCIDAQTEGNESRYINSISPTTPSYIKQNASMSTVWCRGTNSGIIKQFLMIPPHSYY